MANILITGCSGFIGMHLCERMLTLGHSVIGIDNNNAYYSQKLKLDRLARLQKYQNFNFYKIDIRNSDDFQQIENQAIDVVFHLAAQAGVRYSLSHPEEYVSTNLTGFFNVIEFAIKKEVKNFFYASSSSVYGNNPKTPSSEEDKTENPQSIYAATKKSNELLAHSYSKTKLINTIGLRFFTVYGPWGRPDMALFKFSHHIQRNMPIDLYNHGQHLRDFTYIDDVITSISKLYDNYTNTNQSGIHEIFNIGGGNPVELIQYVKIIESHLKKVAEINSLPMQLGDVKDTFANAQKLQSLIHYKPDTTVEIGIEKFIAWYVNYTASNQIDI